VLECQEDARAGGRRRYRNHRIDVLELPRIDQCHLNLVELNDQFSEIGGGRISKEL